MENRNFGMEYARMEWKILKIEWKTIFRVNLKKIYLDFMHGIYLKICTDSDK